VHLRAGSTIIQSTSFLLIFHRSMLELMEADYWQPVKEPNENYRIV